MPGFGTIISVVWSFVSGNWTKAAQLIVDWHKAGLDATATHEKTEADLASRDLELQGRERDINAREQVALSSSGGAISRALTMGPMWLLCWGVGLYYFKNLAIDKALRPFVMYFNGCDSDRDCPQIDRILSTDPLSADLTSVALGVVAYYTGRALIGAGASIATSIAGSLRGKA